MFVGIVVLKRSILLSSLKVKRSGITTIQTSGLVIILWSLLFGKGAGERHLKLKKKSRILLVIPY